MTPILMPGDVSALFQADMRRIVDNAGFTCENLEERELQRRRSKSATKGLPSRLSECSPELCRDILESVFLDYLHLVARRVSPTPRFVFDGLLPRDSLMHQDAIAEIKHRLAEGLPLGDRASRDTFDRTRIDQNRKDYLFRNWSIVHLHLSRVFDAVDRRHGSEQVLFAYVDGNGAVLLAVTPHDFTHDDQLLGALQRAAPRLLSRWELKGVVGLARETTMEERQRLMKAEINTIIPFGGKFYIQPGMGAVTSGHASRFVRLLDDIMHVAFDEIQVRGLQAARNLKLDFDGVSLLLRERLQPNHVLYKSSPIA